ncbi:MAG: YggS family pyridoxal phosphate-dependent enzyme [Oscillospiraceae bacterium]
MGENKVQEMLQKCDYLSATPHKTHIIGHLQTNKVKFLPDKVQMIQSVDSEKLVDEIEKCYGAENKICEVLVEVNIGDEIAKTGINKNDAESLCYYIAQRQHLALKGLMCIPPNCEGDMVRKYFEKMYAMFVDIRAKKLDNSNIDTLSMGMSGDFDLAIMEGATMVRVGTSLFGKRNYN